MSNEQLPLTPYFDRVFVIRDETIERTKHGVIIPDGDKEKPNRGVVIAVGPTCTNFTFKGQHIIFGQHHGFELQIGTDEITVLREQDIYAGEKKGESVIVTQADIYAAKATGISPLEAAQRRHTPEEFKQTLDNIVGL